MPDIEITSPSDILPQWVRTPGFHGCVLLSMLLHIIVLAMASEYRITAVNKMNPPVLVRILPPWTPMPEKAKPPVREAAPEIKPEKIIPAPKLPKQPEVAKPDVPRMPDTLEAPPSPIEKPVPAVPAVPDIPAIPQIPAEGPGAMDLSSLNPDVLDSEDIRKPVPGRDALFDTEIITRRALKPAIKEGRDNGITFDTNDVVLTGYMGLLKQKVEGAWKYPFGAQKEGIFGDLLIQFIVRRDGTLGDVHVTRTSGHVVLDDAAMAALRKAEPFWPLPEAYSKEALQINGRFIYMLSGKYLN